MPKVGLPLQTVVDSQMLEIHVTAAVDVYVLFVDGFFATRFTRKQP